MIRLTVQEDDAGQRLDRFLRKALSKVPLSRIHRLIRTGGVRVSGRRGKREEVLEAGAALEVDVETGDLRPRKRGDDPARIVASRFFTENFHLLHEDEDLLVIDKPSGLLVHRGPEKTWQWTLLDLVRAYCATTRPPPPGTRVFEPSLVHRLDRQTTGVMVVAASGRALRSITAAFREGRVDKEYRTLVAGRVEAESGEIDLPLRRTEGRPGERIRVRPGGEGARRAVSRYRVLRRFRDATWLSVKIETGRTHQIRAHLASIAHPVLGDGKYGDYKRNRAFRKRTGIERYCLHAHTIQLPHPADGRMRTWTASVSPDLQRALEALKGSADGRSR